MLKKVTIWLEEKDLAKLDIKARRDLTVRGRSQFIGKWIKSL